MNAPSKKRRLEHPSMPRVLPRAAPSARKLHPSKLLASSTEHHPERPTVVMLTVGGPSYMSNEMVGRWLQHADDAQVNFTAIQASADKSDPRLEELLRAHVPQGASLYLVQCDVRVPDDELEEALRMLSDLKIPLAERLVANGHNDQLFVPELFRQDEDTQPGLFHLLPSTGHPLQDRHSAEYEGMRTQMEGEQNMQALDALIAALDGRISDLGGDPTASLPACVVGAFNKLQFATHWQQNAEGGAALRQTAGAQALLQLLKHFSIDRCARRQLEDPLVTLLAAMSEDPSTCQSALDAAGQLDPDTPLVIAVLGMHVACIEHRVRSVELEQPKALQYARRVLRYEILEQVYASEVQGLRQSRTAEKHDLSAESRLCSAFHDALIRALLGGEQETPDNDPIATAVEAICRRLELQADEVLQEFLDNWEPWQELLRRGEAQEGVVPEPQEPTK